MPLNDFLNRRKPTYSLWLSSTKYGARPSDLLGIRHPVLAYMFDDAVATFGLHIDAKLQEKKPNGKYKYRLDKLLIEDDEKPVKRGISEADLMKMAAWGGTKKA